MERGAARCRHAKCHSERRAESMPAKTVTCTRDVLDMSLCSSVYMRYNVSGRPANGLEEFDCKHVHSRKCTIRLCVLSWIFVQRLRKMIAFLNTRVQRSLYLMIFFLLRNSYL